MQKNSQNSWIRRKTLLLGVVFGMCLLLAGFAFGSELEFSADAFFSRFLSVETEAEDPEELKPVRAANGFTFKQLDNHPDNLTEGFATSPRLAYSGDSLAGIVSGGYKDLLSVYTIRQGTDDNFTLRAIDMRTGGLLEVVTLDSLRAIYDSLGTIDWREVDRARRVATRAVVDVHEARGVDRDSISVKWGRMNQVLEARQRELPYIEHEVGLTNFFGLSLLATEIGTVETFNMDRVVSRVGARSRYQIMPSVLRDFDVNHYRLDSKGSQVRVYEEWHPLISMEVSMQLVRAYSNAVGHEIPGISAYHTGPFNIFHIYESFLDRATSQVARSATTEFAYLWGITEGYNEIRSSSSFKGYSRGYIPSGYGSLRTTDELPVDTSLTVTAERVQMKSGKQIYLSELLSLIGDLGRDLTWNASESDSTLYLKFRSLNSHMNLPRADDNHVPTNGDVLLVQRVKKSNVRFFLPLGMSDILSAQGVELFDQSRTFRYARGEFGDELTQDKTVWDLEYQQLIDDASNFDFSQENRERLFELVDKFKELAVNDHSFYRQSQLTIIKQHQWIWRSKEFTKFLEILDRSGLAERETVSLPVISELPSLRPQPIQSPIGDLP